MHNGDGKQHNFIVEDVERKEEETKVSLTVDGKSLGVDRTEGKKVEIPSLGDLNL